MRLSQLIRELKDFQETLLEEAEEDGTVETNPLIVLASDEEGNGFHELYELELSFEPEVQDEWLIFWPSGTDLVDY